MHWLKCSLLVTTLCATYWQDSAALENSTINTKNSSSEALKKNDKNLKLTDSAEFEPIFTVKITRDTTTNSIGDVHSQNTAEESKVTNITNLNPGRKREVANVSFNEIKPLLFFPILPFLFPSREKENQSSGNNFLSPQHEKVKVDSSPNDVKPFIFFDFAFIRRIPLNNTINNTDDSSLINVKKLRISKAEDSKKNFLKSRRRRNTSIKLETPEFFDESPLFPDSELDEFLPKSDLFFPDLPFHHHKPLKKLSRRKRDQKKPDLKSDLKIFFDAFDEAFMQTKRELERTDPILNFLRGGQPSFDDDKKKNIFGQISNVQEKPRMKWRIQRNIKRLKNDHQDGMRKDQDGPMIIVDKVVKIGEFHVPDEGLDKDKLKKKKRESEAKKKLIDELTSFEKDDSFPKNIFDLKQEEKRKKRNHSLKSVLQNDSKIQSKVNIVPQITASGFSVPLNITSDKRKMEAEINPVKNKTTDNLKYGNLMKVIDTLKARIKLEVTNDAETREEKLNHKGLNHYETAKKTTYENLKRNITELLNQFLNLSKNSDDVNLGKRAEHGEVGVFDWTEKETLLNSNALAKNLRERRQKKDSDFVEDYVDLSKKERQIADLNYLFLTVTLPTVFVFALVLLVCFFSLHVKGKICTKLFKPRHVFVVEDEKFMQFKKPSTQTSPKHQPI